MEVGPCCVEWKKKYSKLEERRNALRQAVKLLEQQTDKLQNENVELKLEIEEERKRFQLEKEGKEKELNVRKELEKEISKLNTELTTLQNDNKVKSYAGADVQKLKTSNQEADAEINRLKQLFDKEKKRGDLEKKKADIEKKNAMEAWNLVEKERSRAEEERKIAEVEKSYAGVDVQKLKACNQEADAEINRLKQLLDKEKKRGDVEKKKADTEKKKVLEACNLVEKERSRAEEERQIAEVEKSKAEELRVSLEKSKNEASKLREELIAERMKADEAIKRADAQRKKATKERKDANLQRAKIEQLQSFNQESNKTVVELKFRLDQLHEQLMAEKLATQGQQKEARGNPDNVSHVDHISRVNAGANDEKVRILKEKLKLEKKQLKHAKKVSKLHELEKQFLKRELNFLKEDLFQLSRRLNVLDSNLCLKDCSAAGNMSSKGRSKLVASPGYDIHSELNQSNPKSYGLFNQLGITTQSHIVVPESGVNCDLPASGINSNMESPVGDFFRNMPESYVTCSTTESFSDRQFMGSQERVRSPATTTLTEMKKNANNNKNSEIDNRQIDLVDDTDGYGHSDKKSVRPAVSVNYESNRKRRRIEDRLKSVMWLYSKDKKTQLKIEDELKMIGNLLSEDNNRPVNYPVLDEPRTYLESGEPPSIKISRGCYTSNTSKSNFSKDEADLKDEKMNILASPFGTSAAVLTNRQLGTCQDLEKDNMCVGEPGNVLGNADSQVGLHFVDYVTTGDVMSLFPLENEANEECFRIAIATPLSPTLPILDSPRLEVHAVDYSFLLVEDMHHRDSLCSGGSTSHSGALDVVDLEIDLIKQELRASQQPHGSLPGKANDCFREVEQCEEAEVHEKTHNSHACGQSISVSADKAPHPFASRGGSDNGDCPVQGCTSSNLCIDGNYSCSSRRSYVSKNCQFSLNNVIAMKKTADTVNESPLNLYQSQKPSSITVVFCSTKCHDKIARIVSATSSISQASHLFEIEGWLFNILQALETNTELHIEEKACTFVSVMISHLTRQFPETDESSYIENVNAESLKSEIETLVTDGEQKSLISNRIWAEHVTRLIMNFLVHCESLMIELRQTESMNYFDPPVKKQYPSQEDIIFSYKRATLNQLLAGSIILASFCDVLNCAPLLWEVCYDILLSHNSDIAEILVIVHVFASVCGKKMFSIAENDASTTTISFVILHLESALQSGHNTMQSASRVYNNYPCQKCPYTHGYVDVDRVIHIVLTKLEDCVISQISGQCRLNSVLSTSESVQRSKSYSVAHKEQLDPLYSLVDETFVSFADTLSLLELLASYMDWRWICDKIFPRLLKIFDLCTTMEYSAAIIILLGKLSRLGIDFDGFEQDGIDDMRTAFLSVIMEPNSVVNQNLQIQLCAVNAVADLLPVQIEELIGSQWNDRVDRGVHHCAKGVQDWFSQLTENQKALARSFFGCADAAT